MCIEGGPKGAAGAITSENVGMSNEKGVRIPLSE